MQLNTRSLRANKTTIEALLQQESIDIGIFSETWLDPDTTAEFSRYKTYTENRSDGYGGVAIIVHQKFNANKRNVSIAPLEIIEVSVRFKNSEHTMVSVYIPPATNNTSLTQAIEKLFDLYANKPNVYIGGDFNAHHHLWCMHTHNNSTRGNLIAGELSQSNLILLNDGSHTYQNVNNNYFSAIDLSIVSQNYAHNAVWRVSQDCTGSDHLPIICDIGTPVHTSNNRIVTILNKKKLFRYIPLIDFSSATSIEEFEIILRTRIADCTITVRSNKKYKPKHWWTEKINRLWIIKREKQREYFKS